LDFSHSKDLTVRVDLELLNSFDVYKWATNGKSTFSTAVSKPVLQQSDNDEKFKFLLGFDDLAIKSTMLDLNDNVLTGLANVSLIVRVISINSDSVRPPSAKPLKGAPPPPVTPAEETMIEICIPIRMVLISKGSSFSLMENLEVIPSAYSNQIGVKG